MDFAPKLQRYPFYRFVSELLWGCVPVDREWAESTPIFKDNYERILIEYKHFLSK